MAKFLTDAATIAEEIRTRAQSAADQAKVGHTIQRVAINSLAEPNADGLHWSLGPTDAETIRYAVAAAYELTEMGWDLAPSQD